MCCGIDMFKIVGKSVSQNLDRVDFYHRTAVGGGLMKQKVRRVSVNEQAMSEIMRVRTDQR